MPTAEVLEEARRRALAAAAVLTASAAEGGVDFEVTDEDMAAV